MRRAVWKQVNMGSSRRAMDMNGTFSNVCQLAEGNGTARVVVCMLSSHCPLPIALGASFTVAYPRHDNTEKIVGS